MAQLFSLCIFMLLLVMRSSVMGSIDPTDLESLASFYNGLTTKGSLNWDTSSDLCLPANGGYLPSTSSPIVSCDASSPQRVTHLNLTGMGLAGTVPTNLGSLSALITLQLSNNQLYGSIPTQFSLLTNLLQLELQGNLFTGDLSFLSSMTNLNTAFVGGENNNFCPEFDFSFVPNNDISFTTFCGLSPFCSSSPCQNGATCFAANRTCGCLPGYIGDFCQSRVICDGTTADNATWPRGLSGQITYGSCQTGFIGQPSRMCQTNGTFGPLMGRCYPTTLTCPVNAYLNANWPETFVGTTSTGTCFVGYSGTPTRLCFRDGSWSLALNTYCRRNRCPAVTEGSLSWPEMDSLSVLTAKCPTGTTGTIQKTCQADGTWAATVNSCVTPPPCAVDYYGRTTWPTTAAGLTATGVCNPGYSGSPKRICNSSGVWQTLITNYCQRIRCSAITAGGISFPAADSGTKSIGSCSTGSGSPYKYCDLNGFWSATYGSCA